MTGTKFINWELLFVNKHVQWLQYGVEVASYDVYLVEFVESDIHLFSIFFLKLSSPDREARPI